MNQRISPWVRSGLGAMLLIASACSDDVPEVTTGDSDTSSTGDPMTTTTVNPTTMDTTVGETDVMTDGMTGSDTTEGVDTTEGMDTTIGDTEDDTTTDDAVCGDDVADDGEECDGTDLGGVDCISEGFDAGRIGCGDDCTLDTSGCVMFSCGDDMTEGMEVCDGTDIGAEDCLTQGFDAGMLGCAGDCMDFDTSGCVMFSCGNDMTEGMEVCDGTDIGAEDCLTQGFDAGVLGCAGDCMGFDTSGCMMFSCGNDMIEGMEVCDGADLAGEDCISQGFTGGTLGCDMGCMGYDTSLCTNDMCGNDMTEGMEVCDGVDLGMDDCTTQGFDGGTLACALDCSAFDTAGCGNFGGDCCAPNGTIGCDDAGCQAAICAVDAFCCDTEWDAACANAALLDLACVGVGGSCPGAAMCGNDLTEGGEACDGTDLTGETCITQGFGGGGVLSCLGDCSAFDTTMCIAGSDCCVNNGSPGCDDAVCEADVCAVDAFCCDNTWDGICADQALISCPVLCPGGMMDVCGDGAITGAEVCEAGDLAGEDCISQGFAGGGVLACAGDCLSFDTAACIGGPAGDCCIDNGTPGCDDAVCEADVCAVDAFCCDNTWDQVCADQALISCPVLCPGGMVDVCGDGMITGAEDCEAGDLAGEDCISQGFAGGGVLACAGDCSFDTTACIGGPAGDCCADNGTPGCDDAVCEADVCAVDAFCCDNTWDQICADQALISCPVLCGGMVDVCGDGMITGAEDCDGADLAGNDCTTVPGGFIGGVLACDGASCLFDTGACMPGMQDLSCSEEDLGGALGVPVSMGNTDLEDDTLDPTSCGGTSGPDRVFTFTAPAAGDYTISTDGSSYDTKLALYDDCNAMEVVCDDDGGIGTQSLISTTLAAGQQILIVIDGFNGATGDWILNITSP